MRYAVVSIIALTITLGVCAAMVYAQSTPDGTQQAATPIVIPTRDSVFIFKSPDAPVGTAGFIVDRVFMPGPDDKFGEDILGNLFTSATGGKTLEQAMAEYEEIKKTDPEAAEQFKAEYQNVYDEQIAQEDAAMTAEIEEKLQRLARGDLEDSDFTIITPEPVRTLTDPDRIIAALGPDATDILSSLNLTSPEMLLSDYEKNKELYETYMGYSLGLNKVFGRVYEDRGVKPDGAYYYRVTYVDAEGKKLATTDHMIIQVKPAEPPAVEGFSGEAKDGGAILSWAKPENPVALGVDVFRSTSRDGSFNKVNRGVISFSGDPKFFDNSLNNDQEYFYYVAAADLVGNHSPASEVIEILPRDMTPPAPPVDVAVEKKDEGVLLTWSMNLEPDMDVYHVYRSEDRDEPFSEITQPLPSDVTSYFDETIEDGKMYFYHLSAVDNNGNFSTSSVTVQLKLPDTVPPKTPLGFTGKPVGKDMIALSWEQSEDPDLFGYNVYRGETPDNLEIANQGPLPKETTKYEDFGVNSGRKYYYALKAVDTSMNESDLTEPILVTAPDSVPPVFPSGLFPMGEDSKVTISWAPSQDSDLSLYRLYYSDEENGEFTKSGEDIPKDILSVVDEPVENGKKRWYYLTAVDESGNESEPSSTVPALPYDTVPPQAPSNATGTVMMKTVSLEWEPGPDEDIAGYTVCRAAVSRTGVCDPISGDSPLPGNKLAFKDTIPEPGVNYWYRIIAVDTSENKSMESAPAGPFMYEQKESTGTPKDTYVEDEE